ISKVGKAFSLKMRAMRPLKRFIKPVIRFSSSLRRNVVVRRESQMREDFSPRSIARELDATLRRLKVETLDGLLLHNPPATVVAQPEMAELLNQLKSTGKVRHYGVSCDDEPS